MSQLLLQVNHLYKSFSSHPLFENASFSINQGDILALVGLNGTGKTTLLHLLSGITEADQGQFSKSPHLRIGFLPQEIVLVDPEMNVSNYLDDEMLATIERQMTLCLENPDQIEDWANLHEKYERLGGYQKLPIEKVLHGLKIDNTLLEVSMKSLSSGQRVRVALAKALIANPDLLLLDEPTNHLDEEMISWLSVFLKEQKKTALIVSHHRDFINATCNSMIEISNRKFFTYGGNYDFYLMEKRRQIELRIKNYEAQQEEIKLLKSKIKTMTYARQKPKPPKDRNFMAYDHKGDQHQKSIQRNLDQMKKRLNQIEENATPHPYPKTIKGMQFQQTTTKSPICVELTLAGKSYDNKILFSNFSKVIKKGDRVIITGPNGCGKTTLLKCIAGLIPLDSGKLTYAHGLRIGYLDQENDLLPCNETPLTYFEKRFNLSEEEIRSELHKSAIGGENLLQTPFMKFSTGQKKRFHILTLIFEKPDLLLLDEPTNHLDLLTLEAFEVALQNFDGAILAVSHDRTFINRIQNQVLALPINSFPSL